MKNMFIALLALCLFSFPLPLRAWDGFDADSADLVEITPDEIPQIGATVSVRNHDTDTTEDCLVMSVKRNSRTIEIVARYADGKEHLFVMEWR